MPSVSELIRASSLIFTGTILESGTSSVPAVRPNQDLIVARVDRALRVDPALGDLVGKHVTILAATPQTLHVGQQAVFFTQSWIHGQGIAVRELDHLEAAQADTVAKAVANLPQDHLIERLRGAALVVEAEVTKIGPPDRSSRVRKAPWWAPAELNVKQVLRGTHRKSATVYFPTADWPPWTRAPHFKQGERGIFLLHVPPDPATPREVGLKQGGFVALDPSDFQPESQLAQITKLLADIH
jgi:hypothetical protein